MNPDDIIATKDDFLTTEMLLKNDVSADSVLSIVSAKRTTGRLTFEFNSGGVRSVTLIQRTKADEKQREGIRKILGVE